MKKLERIFREQPFTSLLHTFSKNADYFVKIKKVYNGAQVRLCRLFPELGQLPSERKQSRQIGTSGANLSALRFFVTSDS